MKLFHIDRLGRLSENSRIDLFSDYSVNGFDCSMIKTQYPEGITEHGNIYLFEPNENSYIESVFELIRRMHYPSALSRFQCVFAVAEQDLGKMKNVIRASTDVRIFEVEAETYEKRDMSLLTGKCHFLIEHFAHDYWSGNTSLDPLYEYLLKPPVFVKEALR